MLRVSGATETPHFFCRGWVSNWAFAVLVFFITNIYFIKCLIFN